MGGAGEYCFYWCHKDEHQPLSAMCSQTGNWGGRRRGEDGVYPRPIPGDALFPDLPLSTQAGPDVPTGLPSPGGNVSGQKKIFF